VAVQATLEDIAQAAITFYRHNFPMAASLFAEPQLLAAHSQALRERGAGPARVVDAVAGYLTAEQDLGRVEPAADPQAAAALLLGACFQHAFLSYFTDRRDDEDSDRRFAVSLVATLVGGLLPHQAIDRGPAD
jgi:hypothetical protein